MPSGGLFGILDSLTTGEVMIILVVALVVLGPDRLPEMARTIGAWVAKARRIAANLEGEMREVVERCSSWLTVEVVRRADLPPMVVVRVYRINESIDDT